MYKSMKVLIEKRFYKAAEEARGKIDVFFAVGRISGEEYRDLDSLIAEVYG